MNIFDLIINDKEVVSLEDVFLNNQNKENIKQFIKEHQYVQELTQYGLPVNNKILLEGHTGCGKTTTAKAIANALEKPLFAHELVKLHKILNRFSIKQRERNPFFFWMSLIKLEKPVKMMKKM